MRRRRLRLLSDMLDLIERQTETINQLRAQHAAVLERQRIDLELSYTRISRDLISQFIIVLDEPEKHDDVRVKLFASLQDFNDEVARLEEQTTG